MTKNFMKSKSVIRKDGVCLRTAMGSLEHSVENVMLPCVLVAFPNITQDLEYLSWVISWKLIVYFELM